MTLSTPPSRSPPTEDLFIYPWVAYNILFICSSKVYWNRNRLASLYSLCSSIKNNTKDLLASIGSSMIVQSSECRLHPGAVCYASLGAVRLRYPPVFNMICNSPPFLQAWHIPWQLAHGSDARWRVACIYISTDTHPPPPQTTRQCMHGTRWEQYARLSKKKKNSPK